jgi:hypothetical protein
MRLARPTTLLSALGLLVALGSAAPGSAAAQTATASGGCNFSVHAAKPTVRRGGRVLLKGTACAGGSAASSPARVSVRLRKTSRWASVASTAADSSGDFSVCVPIRVPRQAKVARLQVQSADGTSRNLNVRLSNKGKGICVTPKGPGGNYPTFAQDPPPNPNCPLAHPGAEIDMTLPSACTQLASDTASNPDPNPFWGKVDCQTGTRHQRITSGGDPHSTGSGAAQGNSDFRRMTVYDGDEVYGERCELGNNNVSGPTVFYHEGQRRVTYVSIRMPNSSDINDSRWRNVFQMKQVQPYYNPNPASIFEMQVRDGRWFVGSNWTGVWDAPAQQNTWTRFAFDMTYSQDPSKGSVKIYADLNGDGDANDAEEQSPLIHMATLRAETAGGPDNPDFPSAGQSIPSHMRAGIYQDESYSCPSGCSVDLDNVQVFRA